MLQRVLKCPLTLYMQANVRKQNKKEMLITSSWSPLFKNLASLGLFWVLFCVANFFNKSSTNLGEEKKQLHSLEGRHFLSVDIFDYSEKWYSIQTQNMSTRYSIPILNISNIHMALLVMVLITNEPSDLNSSVGLTTAEQISCSKTKF